MCKGKIKPKFALASWAIKEQSTNNTVNVDGVDQEFIADLDKWALTVTLQIIPWIVCLSQIPRTRVISPLEKERNS